MQPQTRRPNTLAVHSVDRFVFSVPNLDEARRFYTAFGLDVQRSGTIVQLRTFGDDHVWADIIAGGPKKRLEYLRFGTCVCQAHSLVIIGLITKIVQRANNDRRHGRL